jgi:hypothetical protein
LERAFIVRARSFAEWLVERTPLQQTRLRGRLRLANDGPDKNDERSSSMNGAPSPLHSAYALTAGLVFYKMLERSHNAIPALKCCTWHSRAALLETVRDAFSQSGGLEPGFAPLFQFAAEGASIIPDTQQVLTGVRTFVEELDRFPLERIEPDAVGAIFESLIPWVERHQLGQFYTPPFIAEVLARWAVRRSTDRVLDPACGAGIILTKAYGRLRGLKERCADPSCETARSDVSSQLYGLDVDPVAIRLAAASLAIQDLSLYTGTARFTVEDFFNVQPRETTTEQNAIANRQRAPSQDICLPRVDAVVTNPPYTRWSELPQTARRQIRGKLGGILRTYNLSAKRGWGGDAGLHIYFIIWAHRFLRPGGRLAVIVSNSWLQADFGTGFGRFLLDHFRVCAVVDLGARVFPSPLVATCLLLLEREDDPAARAANTTRFIYLSASSGSPCLDVDSLLHVIDGVQSPSPDLRVREVAQRDIPADSKWIQNLFDVQACLEPLKRHPLITRLESLCDVAYGNTTYLVQTSRGAIGGVPNVGGERFFHLSDRDAQTWRLSPPWVHPLLPSGRYAQFFHFTKTDWETLRAGGVRCWLFTAHASHKLPRPVAAYIRHGERSVKLRGMKRSGESSKTVNQSLASSIRHKYPQHFKGWYDLGDVEPAPIFAIRGTQHRPRFILSDFPVGLDDRLVALIPKIALREQQLKALVASLNSAFTQLQIEVTCRTTGGGMAELDLRHTAELLVPNVTQLPSETVAALAKLFEMLEEKTRQLGGADKETHLAALAPIFAKIDAKLAERIGLPQPLLRRMQGLVSTLAQRRLTRTTAPLTL